MKRILTFYLSGNLFAVTATIRCREFITIELIYPFKGITADYYCEDGEFLNIEIPFKIQEFGVQICKAYLDLATKHKFFLEYVEHAKVVYPTENINETTHRFLELQFETNLIRDFFSAQSYGQLVDAYLHTLSSGPFLITSNILHRGIEKQLLIALDAILKSQVSEVLIFPYSRLLNSPPKAVVIDLSTEEIPEEKLLQELIINSPLATNINLLTDLWDSQFLRQRFNEFSDQKRLKLFMICNVNKDLFMYNKHLARWWMNRY